MLLDLFDKAGNLFDLPGSMVRDALTLNNPLDQLLSPLSSDNRMDGRDVLEKWGMLGPNTEGLDVGDVAGTAAGIALDPLTWVSGAGVMKLLGRGSKAAKAGTGTKAAQALLEAPQQSRALVPYRAPSSPLQSILQGPTSPMTPVDADPFAIMRQALGQPAALPAPAPVFYSRLRRAVEQLPDNPKGFKSQSVLNMLKKAPEGISMDEFNFSGLPEQLAKSPVVSKAMLMDVLDDGNVAAKTLRQTVPYSPKNSLDDYRRSLFEQLLQGRDGSASPAKSLSWLFGDEQQVIIDSLNSMKGGFGDDVASGAASWKDLYDLYMPENKTRWSEYTMPNGKNYTETLLTEPIGGEGRAIDRRHYELEKALFDGVDAGIPEGGLSPAQWAEIRQLRNMPNNTDHDFNRTWLSELKQRLTKYQSPHWDEPNVTAHLRTTTRLMDDPATGMMSPTYFIDELQSDWHQAGRKFDEITKADNEWTAVNKDRSKIFDEVQARQLGKWGYTDDDLLTNPRKSNELWSKTTEYRGRSPNLYEYMDDAELAAVRKLDGRLRELRKILDPYENGDLEIGEVASSPFRNHWQDVALKRALYDAAAQGSEGIGWSLGEDIQEIVGGVKSGQDKFYDEEIGNRLRKLLASKGQKDAKPHIRGIPEVIGDGDTIGFTGVGNYIAMDPQTRARILAEGFPLLSLPFLAAFGLTGGEQRGVQ